MKLFKKIAAIAVATVMMFSMVGAAVHKKQVSARRMIL